MGHVFLDQRELLGAQIGGLVGQGRRELDLAGVLQEPDEPEDVELFLGQADMVAHGDHIDGHPDGMVIGAVVPLLELRQPQ